MIQITSIGDILKATDAELVEVLSSNEIVSEVFDFRRIALAQLTSRVRDEAYLNGMKAATDMAMDVLKTEVKKYSKGTN